MSSPEEGIAIERLRARGIEVKLRKDGTAGAVAVGPQSLELDDDAVADVAACRRLRQLDLSRSSLTDQQLARLATLAELTEFQLAATNVTVDGIERLADLPRLKLLVVTGCALDVHRLRELRKRMINTRIVG